MNGKLKALVFTAAVVAAPAMALALPAAAGQEGANGAMGVEEPMESMQHGEACPMAARMMAMMQDHMGMMQRMMGHMSDHMQGDMADDGGAAVQSEGSLHGMHGQTGAGMHSSMSAHGSGSMMGMMGAMDPASVDDAAEAEALVESLRSHAERMRSHLQKLEERIAAMEARAEELRSR